MLVKHNATFGVGAWRCPVFPATAVHSTPIG